MLVFLKTLQVFAFGEKKFLPSEDRILARYHLLRNKKVSCSESCTSRRLILNFMNFYWSQDETATSESWLEKVELLESSNTKDDRE